MTERKEVISALIEAKKKFLPAIKDSVNPHFKTKFASLSSCMDSVNNALLSCGIALVQEVFEHDSGVSIETIFMHVSGQEIRCGKVHIPASKKDAHAYGSALSYARRYSMMTACGIAAEDDDGTYAAKASAQKEEGKLEMVAEEIRKAEGDKEAIKAILKANSFGLNRARALISYLHSDIDVFAINEIIDERTSA